MESCTFANLEAHILLGRDYLKNSIDTGFVKIYTFHSDVCRLLQICRCPEGEESKPKGGQLARKLVTTIFIDYIELVITIFLNYIDGARAYQKNP